MVKVKIQIDGTIWIDGIQYDKMTKQITAGILTLKAEKIQKPSGRKVKLTLKTSSFAIYEDK